MKKVIMIFAFLLSTAFAIVPASYAGDHGHDAKSKADTHSSDSKSKDDKSSDDKSKDDKSGDKH